MAVLSPQLFCNVIPATSSVIPAKAGIQTEAVGGWITALAGMTKRFTERITAACSAEFGTENE